MGSAFYGWEALWKMLGEKASGISNPPGTVDTEGTSVDVGGIRLLQGAEADWGGGTVRSSGQGSREGQSSAD